MLQIRMQQSFLLLNCIVVIYFFYLFVYLSIPRYTIQYCCYCSSFINSVLNIIFVVYFYPQIVRLLISCIFNFLIFQYYIKSWFYSLHPIELFKLILIPYFAYSSNNFLTIYSTFSYSRIINI